MPSATNVAAPASRARRPAPDVPRTREAKPKLVHPPRIAITTESTTRYGLCPSNINRRPNALSGASLPNIYKFTCATAGLTTRWPPERQLQDVADCPAGL